LARLECAAAVLTEEGHLAGIEEGDEDSGEALQHYRAAAIQGKIAVGKQAGLQVDRQNKGCSRRVWPCDSILNPAPRPESHASNALLNRSRSFS
jgi:hypothetical protein